MGTFSNRIVANGRDAARRLIRLARNDNAINDNGPDDGGHDPATALGRHTQLCA